MKNEKCEFLARESVSSSPIVRIFGNRKRKFIANFSATMVTSLPSLSLSVCISLSLSLSPKVPHAQYRKRFRASYNIVVGSKLEALVSMGGTCEEIKKVLLAHRQTADKLWKQLITTTQQSESFRQWCVRIATDCKLVQFIQLTNENKSSSPEDDELSYAKKAKSVDSFVDTLLKFLIFEGCSKRQKTYFLERKFVQLSFDEFQEVGVAFQEAHGCRHTGKDRIPKAESVDFDDDNQSMQTWKTSVQEKTFERKI